MALVPAGNIIDTAGKPERFSSIIIGDGMVTYGDRIEEFYDRVALTLHLWADEPSSSAAVKAIAGPVREALTTRPWTIEGFTCPYLAVTSARYVRERATESEPHAHAIMLVEATMQPVGL